MFSKPFLPFLGLAVISALIAISYDSDSYFEMGGDPGFSIRTTHAWLFFSIYLLILSGIYFTAAKGNLKTRPWLVITHFVFVLLFLVFFSAFSSFDTAFVQDRISGVPLFTLIGIYGGLFLFDLISLLGGLILLALNIFSFRRKR